MGSSNPQASGSSLFGHTRSSLLAILFGRATESFYLRELARMVQTGHGALQRELRHLTQMGLVTRAVQGNQVLFQANPRSPIFSELKSLIAKTVGLGDLLRHALAALEDKIEIAFVYGSVARQQERPNSDVDLMVIGDVSFREVVSVLARAQKTLGREINPTVFSAAEFRSKLAKGNHFLTGLSSDSKNDSKLFLIGTQHEFAQLVAK